MVSQWRCNRHNVVLIIDGNQRIYENPPGSYAGMPVCQLHLMAEPKEGKFGDCEIVKEK